MNKSKCVIYVVVAGWSQRGRSTQLRMPVLLAHLLQHTMCLHMAGEPLLVTAAGIMPHLRKSVLIWLVIIITVTRSLFVPMRVARTRSVSDGVVMCRFSPVCCTYGPLAGPAVWQALSNASPNIFRMPLISHKYSYTSSCSCCCCCCCDCTPSDFD